MNVSDFMIFIKIKSAAIDYNFEKLRKDLLNLY